MKRIALFILAAAAVACGSSPTSPSQTTAAASPFRLSSLADEPKTGTVGNSCSTETPIGLRAGGTGQYNGDKEAVAFEWRGVHGVARYDLEIQRRQLNAAGMDSYAAMPLVGPSVSQVTLSLAPGIYRARVRVVTACAEVNALEPWSGYFEFSVSPKTAAPSVAPPAGNPAWWWVQEEVDACNEGWLTPNGVPYWKP